MKQSIFLILLSLGFSTTLMCQKSENTYLLIGSNFTHIKNMPYVQSSYGHMGGTSLKYSGLKNKIGFFVGVQSNKSIRNGFQINLGGKIILERFEVDSIEGTYILAGKTINSSLGNSINNTINLGLDLTLSNTLIKNKLDIYAGCTVLLGIASCGNMNKKSETYFEIVDNGEFINYLALDPVLVESNSEHAPKFAQFGLILGTSIQVNSVIKLNFNYVHGLSNNFYPFRINRFEFFILHSIFPS